MISLTTNTRGMTVMFSTKSGPELVAAFNEMANQTTGVQPVKRFASTEAGIRRCEDLAKKIGQSQPKKPKSSIGKFGVGVKIKILLQENPRREGTLAFNKWKELTAFLSKNSNADLAEVMANTSYQRRDYEWDLKRKNIE